MEFTTRALRRQGFTGFVRAETLLDQRERDVIPKCDGIYVAVYDGPDPPSFVRVSPAGWWKGRNPTLPLDDLRARWVPRATVVYVGKANRTPKNDLRERVRKLVRYGAGSVIGHEGGRAIWQLHADSLRIAWRETAGGDIPRLEERRLIDGFRDRYGALPFGNAI